MSDLEESAKRIENFSIGPELTKHIAVLEDQIRSKGTDEINNFLTQEKIDNSLMDAAQVIKRVAGEVNVIIHAIGILLYLPVILEPDEQVEYVSLGAGNTGKEFDLKTNKRIAEFKFINWRTKSNTIRENKLFKDIFNLAEHETDGLTRYMYVVAKEKPMQFLNCNRALTSVLSKNQSTYNKFYDKYGDRYSVVSEYYNDIKSSLKIEDLREIEPNILRSIEKTPT